MTNADTTGTGAEGRIPLGTGYWWLWGSSTLSNLADGLLLVALPLVAIQVTRSPILVSGLTVAATLPWLLFALQAGALADRHDRRRLMLGANLARACLVGLVALLAATGTWSIWAIYVVVLAIGVAETIYDTSAQSILPQVVAREQLSRANSRLAGAQLAANEFVGPPLGGVLVAAGAVVAFAVPGALWLAAVGALFLVRGSFQVPRETGTTMRADIAEGLRYLWNSRVLRTMAVMTGAFNFASNAMFAIFVLYAVGPSSAMGLSEPAYGLLLATLAAGSVTGSLVAERIERRAGRARTLFVAFAGASLMSAVPAVTANPVAIGLAFFTSGVMIIVANVIMVSLRQRITPDRLLGRANSGYRLLAWGTRPLGALTGGLLAQAIGLRAVFTVVALVTLTTLLGARVVTERTIADAEHSA